MSMSFTLYLVNINVIFVTLQKCNHFMLFMSMSFTLCYINTIDVMLHTHIYINLNYIMLH